MPRHLTYSKCNMPLFGALVDYMETCLEYLRVKSFANAEMLNFQLNRPALTDTFISTVCFVLGLMSNVKLEVLTFEDESLPNDLHFMLMSKDDKLYIDDIDVSKVVWCIEASDTLVILISTLLIWNSSYMGSPVREYMYLPWLGATLRGLMLRQAPTAGALAYTMAVVNGSVSPLFATAFTFLFLLEARVWLEIARLVRARWGRRDHCEVSRPCHYEVQTLWSNDDVQSVEVGNYVY
ncbi:uncharacterized protein LOC112055915 [Bicyclus anynana]|uniref:Uncharacterized protein LOC112055915 n=1 Tax=Bicyclus anynana TaxID=110368 RepID=A0A6J1P1W9_BICAN|nr:uncharacterized protein LOC112055915 [Bicyclus anynana]